MFLKMLLLGDSKMETGIEAEAEIGIETGIETEIAIEAIEAETGKEPEKPFHIEGMGLCGFFPHFF